MAQPFNKTLRLYKPVDDPSVTPASNVIYKSTTEGTSIHGPGQICLLSAGSMFYLTKNGPSGDDEFIGDKIYLKSITYTISITPNLAFNKNYYDMLYNSPILSQYSYTTEAPTRINYTTTPGYNAAPPKPFNINLRLMLVKFNDALFRNSSGFNRGDVDNKLFSDDATSNVNVQVVKSMLAEWFNQSRIYLDASTGNNAYQTDANGVFSEDVNLNQCYQPVFTDRLRDSCKWTGKFEVLWDQKINYKGKPMLFDKTFSINKNCNLIETTYTDSDGQHVINTVSGKTLKNTYLFILGPGALSTDLSQPLFYYAYKLSTLTADFANVQLNTKYTYYDI